MDIHSQVGVIEQPLTTLGEQLTEESKKALEMTAKQAVSRAPYARRARWWIQQNPILAALSAVVLGAIAVLALTSRRD